MKRATLIGMGLVTLCVFGVAFAQQRGQGRGQGQTGDGNCDGPPPGLHPAGPLMLALDTDKDGTLSADEIAAASTALLTLDQDGDGALSRDELRPQRGNGNKASAQAKSGRNAQRVNPIMQQDANGDGVVTLDEFTARAQTAFAKIDTNGDGQIDADEAVAAPPPPHGRRPGGPGPRMGGDQSGNGE